MTNFSRITQTSREIYYASIALTKTVFSVHFSFLKIKFISPDKSLSIWSDQLVLRVNGIRLTQFAFFFSAAFWSPSLIFDKRIKTIAIVKRRSSCVSSFFHLSAIHSSTTLWSISRKYDLHVCIARTLFLLRRFSFIRLVYYEKLV